MGRAQVNVPYLFLTNAAEKSIPRQLAKVAAAVLEVWGELLAILSFLPCMIRQWIRGLPQGQVSLMTTIC